MITVITTTGEAGKMSVYFFVHYICPSGKEGQKLSTAEMGFLKRCQYIQNYLKNIYSKYI